MKRFLLLVLINTQLICHAQLPEKPEDISPLLIGEKLPVITLQNVDGKEISTEAVFSNRQTILIFYRGGWCPYCNTHLNEVGQLEHELIKLGYSIVAISPDAPENLKKSIDKNKLTYTLLSDKTGAFARAVGIAFKAPANYEKMLSEIQGKDAELHLPVPALFIIDENSEILFEYINPNFKKRISGELLLSVAKVFSKSK